MLHRSQHGDQGRFGNFLTARRLWSPSISFSGTVVHGLHVEHQQNSTTSPWLLHTHLAALPSTTRCSTSSPASSASWPGVLPPAASGRLARPRPGHQQPRTRGAAASPRTGLRRSTARFGHGRSRHAKGPGDRDSSRRSCERRKRRRGASEARRQRRRSPRRPAPSSTRCAGTPTARPSASTSTCATTTAPRRRSRTANS